MKPRVRVDQAPTIRILFCIALIFLSPGPVKSAAGQTRKIVAEGVYLMGDGETMSAAQERAKMNAVRKAAEEAGAFIRSYTKTRDMAVEKDVIEMVADHAMKVTVLSSKREMAGDAVRFTVRISAEYSEADIEADLKKAAENLKMADAYRSLQAEFKQQAAELEDLKRQLAAAPESAKKEVLEKIGENERRFRANLAVKEGVRQLATLSFSAAEESFSKAIELDPSAAEAYAGRAEARLSYAKTSELMSDADRAISLQPENARFYAVRARITLQRLCSRQKPEECNSAIADLKRAARLDPKSPVYPILLGETYAGLDQYEKAVAEYERAAALVPSVTMPLVAVNTYLHRAQFYLDQGRPGYLQHALADLDRAVEIVTSPPYFTQDTEKFARLMSEQPKSQQEAAELLKKIFGIDFSALDAEQRAAWGKRFQQAEKVLNSAAQVYWKRAQVRYEAGDAAGAEEDRTAACGSVADPDRGIVDDTTHIVVDADFCKAGRAFRPFATANALAAFQSLKLGERAYGKSRKEAALRHLNRAVELDPRLTAAYLKRAQVYRDIDPPDVGRAIADYSTALEIDPKNAQALLDRGTAYFDLGVDREYKNDPAGSKRLLKAAEADFTRLLALADADLKTFNDSLLKNDARTDRARLYEFMKRYAAAADDYAAAAAKTENYAYFLDQAKALELAGDRPGAVRAIDSYLKEARAALERAGGKDSALAEDIAKAEAQRKKLAGSGG